MLLKGPGSTLHCRGTLVVAGVQCIVFCKETGTSCTSTRVLKTKVLTLGASCPFWMRLGASGRSLLNEGPGRSLLNKGPDLVLH